MTRDQLIETMARALAERDKAEAKLREAVAENERLQEELQSTAMEALTAQGQAWEASERIDAAEAKLREAVELMRAICWYDWSDNDDDSVKTIDAARAFLAKLEKPRDP